ncbi:MAG TPA: hypothetical protein GX708_16700 [Gallicola sp.]|nr:hypothetical protein [Gallicola sp.]
MLKIKDNVDLKELENFGFELDEYGNYRKIIYTGRRGQCFELLINIKYRELLGYSEGADGDGEEDNIDDTLYDLIKADLVEKINK